MRVIFLIPLIFAAYGLMAQVESVVALGSSTTYGMSADPDSAWISRLKRHLTIQYANASVFNLAVPGKDCYHAMPDEFVSPEGRPSPISGKNITAGLQVLQSLDDPSHGLVIVSYASNNYHIYSIQEILFCLQIIYDQAVSSGHRCLVSTTQPRHDRHFESSAAKRKLAVLKDSILNRFGNAAINFYDGFINPADSTIAGIYSAGDNIHFNNAGHRELFRRVAAKIPLITAVNSRDERKFFYPNPVTNRLSISKDDLPRDTQIQLYDALGARVWTGVAHNEYVEMHDFPSGLYVIKWTNKEGTNTWRILKR